MQQSMDKYVGIAALPQTWDYNETFMNIMKHLAFWKKKLSNIMGSPVRREFGTPLKSSQKVTIIPVFKVQTEKPSS